MRVLFVVLSDIRRGQRIGKELETLANAGYEVQVVDLPSEEPTPGSGRFAHKPLKLWTRRLPKNLGFWPLKYLEAVLRAFVAGLSSRPDFVHCVDRLALLPGWLVASVAGVPFLYDTQEIWSEVNTAMNRPRLAWLSLERLLARRAAGIMVTDSFRRTLTARILEQDPSDIHVLMSLPRLASMKRATRTLPADVGRDGRKLIVYAGFLSPHRHLEEIIAALSLLPEEYNLVLIGFGGEPYKATLRAFAEESGVEGRLLLLPPVGWFELTEYLREAHCTLALYEGHSLNNLYASPSKVFDSVMAGVPVVGTDNPLIREVVLDLDAGETIAKVSAATIAAAVRKVVEREGDAERRVRTERMARARYSWEGQEQAFLAFYRACGAGAVDAGAS